MPGYSPASNLTSTLSQAQVIYYDKNFISNLKANTPHLRVTNRRELPENSGNQLELFMYQTLGPNIAQGAEGTVGTGLTVTVLNNKSTIGQYMDFLNYSDLSLQTAIDPALENGQKELSYRLALTLATLVKNTMDGANAVDASVKMGNTGTNTFTKTNIVTAVSSLLGRNVMAFENGRMGGLCHPFAIGDAQNDPSINAVTDILKRTAEGQEKLSELPTGDGEDNVPVLDWAGVTFHSTTVVTVTPNYLAQSGVTALRTYIVGENGVITISLGKKENSMISDGNWRNMELWTNRYTTPSNSDPSRSIGGSTAYNVKFVPTLVPDTTMRLRYIDAATGIS
jgi:hypothetical protein